MSVRYTEPVPPDFYICSEVYGTRLRLADCRAAASNLPGGSTPVAFSLAREGHPVSYPISLEYGESLSMNWAPRHLDSSELR